MAAAFDDIATADAGIQQRLACPACHGPLARTADGEPLCQDCGSTYPRVDGFVDFAPQIPPHPEQAPTAGLAQLRLRDPVFVTRYERFSRPGFLRVMGANWDEQLPEEDEDAYILEHLRPMHGPVLDLACGAGRWTRTVARAAEPYPAIGLDISFGMLTVAHAALPAVHFLRGDARAQPFADVSLGGVNCWNALQSIPEPPAVIREVGRCLMPGGVFTALTFRRARHPTYRYFQKQHEQMMGSQAFAVDDLEHWLAVAGLDVVDISGPGTFLLLTARKQAVG